MFYFILAAVIFLFIYMFAGKDFTPAVIDKVQIESPAEESGLKKNDIILEIDIQRKIIANKLSSVQMDPALK